MIKVILSSNLKLNLVKRNSIFKYYREKVDQFTNLKENNWMNNESEHIEIV